MATQNIIAIIGACSKNGRAAIEKLATGNLRLLLADENKEALLQLKHALDAQGNKAEVELMECMKEAGWEADIVVLALDWQVEKEIFTMIKPFITGKTVISFSKNNNCLLPYSKVIAVREDDQDWADDMALLINNSF